MADTEILEGQIQALESAVLATDERVDGLEANEGDAPDDTIPPGSSTPVEPVIDLAQTVGRLEAEVAQCRLQILELQMEVRTSALQMEAIASIASEPEPEMAVTEVEAPSEPESPSGGEGEPKRNPNWVERLLLVQ